MDEESLLRQILDLTKEWGGSTEDVMKTLRDHTPAAFKLIQDKLAELLKTHTSVADSAKKFVEIIKDPDLQQKIALLTKGLTAVGSALKNSFVEGEAAFKEFADGVAGQAISATLGLDLSLFQTQYGAMKKLVSEPKNALTFGVNIATQAAVDQIGALSEKLDKQLAPKFKWDKMAVEGLGALANPLHDMVSQVETSAGNATKPLKGIRDFFKLEMVNALNTVGGTTEELNKSFQELAHAVPNISIISSLHIKEGTEEVRGLAAAMSLVKATGLSMGEVGEVIGLMTRNLGIAPDKIGEKFQLLTKAAADTGMSTHEMVAEVKAGAREMRFFGDNTESVASEMNVFARALGSGRLENAKELFNSMRKGILGLDDGMKAFIGTTTSLGKGGGAIESILRFDEALASGEGLEEIRKSIVDSVEQLTGSQLMTRKEAIAAGPEAMQAHFMQQKLLAQQTGVQGSGELNQLTEVLQKKDQGSLQKLRAVMTTDQGPGTGIIDRSQNKMEIERNANPLAFAKSQMEAANIASTMDFRHADDAGNLIGAAFVDNMLEAGLVFSDAVRKGMTGTDTAPGMMPKFQQLLSGFTDETSTEMEAKNAAIDAATANKGKGAEAGAALGSGNAGPRTGMYGAGVELSDTSNKHGGLGIAAEISRTRAVNSGLSGMRTQATSANETLSAGGFTLDMITQLQQKTSEVITKSIQSSLSEVTKSLLNAASTPQTIKLEIMPTSDFMIKFETLIDERIKKNSVAQTGF